MAFKHLRDRIGTVGWNSTRQMSMGMPAPGAARTVGPLGSGPGGYVRQPSANAGASGPSTVTGGQASPAGTPQAMPLARVVVGPTTSQYVTLGMEDLTPIWTADGAGIPASASGSWGQVTAAANPREGARRATAARAQRYNNPAPAVPAGKAAR